MENKKILEYTFETNELGLDEQGKLVIRDSKKETLTFTLLHRGIGIYEEMVGEPLVSSIVGLKGEDREETLKSINDKEFILNLAAASYVKIENGKFHNNRATAEEFKKIPYVKKYIDDINFVSALYSMAIACIVDEHKLKSKTNSTEEEKK